jgi:hypothetical protein
LPSGHLPTADGPCELIRNLPDPVYLRANQAPAGDGAAG